MPSHSGPRTMSKVVRGAVEICDDATSEDPERLLERLVDADPPVTTVPDIEPAAPTGDATTSGVCVVVYRVSDHDLFERWRSHRDRRAREELVRRHLGLARKLAARYRRTQEPFEDLLQVASLGLVKAIDRFDHERGAAFSSFAVPTILGELKRHFRDKGWSVHLSRGLQELALKVQEAEARLGSRTGRSPTVIEIAQHLSLDTEQVLEALDAMNARAAISLDAPIGNDARGRR
jgi:RNA polymerase sigma factor (sigma-70 family)